MDVFNLFHILPSRSLFSHESRIPFLEAIVQKLIWNYLECDGAIFIGGATFNSLQCKDGGSFKNTRFGNREKDIDFRHARFGVLDCCGATFSSGANFNSLRCESGYFRNAQFENQKTRIDFSVTRFGATLEFQAAIFVGKVDFKNIEVAGTAILAETEFQSGATLNCATICNLMMKDPRTDSKEDSLPFEKSDVDLRRCKFDIFEGTKKQQRHLVKAQSPEKFSMDPYLQFEKYYRSIGDESCAKRVYHDGRVALRKNALRQYYFWSKKKQKERNPEIHWSLGKVLITDWFFRWMVGYGVWMRMPLACILIFLCAGTYAFWPAEAMTPKRTSMMSEVDSFLKDLGLIEQNIKLGGARHTSDDSRLLKVGHKLWYSIDLFIPIVNLRIADEYQRPHGGYAVYAVIHILMGWLLVPLLIASLSGVIKKNERSP